MGDPLHSHLTYKALPCNLLYNYHSEGGDHEKRNDFMVCIDRLDIRIGIGITPSPGPGKDALRCLVPRTYSGYPTGNMGFIFPVVIRESIFQALLLNKRKID
jgi:hypothetical protein